MSDYDASWLRVRCEKTGYATRGDATRALRRIQNDLTATEFYPINAYRCLLCKQWHLTARSRRQGRSEK